MLHNNFVGLLQINKHNVILNDLETFCNELYLFIHLLVQNVQDSS